MLVIFDYDGVFVDSRDQLLAALAKAQRRLGCGRLATAEDLAVIESFTFADVGRRCGVPEAILAAYSDAVLAALRRDKVQPPAYPDIGRVVADLASVHTLAIVTANRRPVVEAVLRREQLLPWFSAILDLDDPGAKSDKINRLRQAYAWSADQTFMVGDAVSDVRQGQLAGVRTVAAAWGMQRRELLVAAGPDFIADQPADLLTFLRPTAEDR